MSTSKEINRVYQEDINKKTRILVEKGGMFPLISDWEEAVSRSNHSHIRGFEVFHIYEHIPGWGELYKIKD